MAEVVLLILVAVPVLAGLALWARGDRPGPLLAVGALGALALTLVVAVLVAVDGPQASLRWGAGITLRVEAADLARAPIVLVAFVGLAVVAYALGYGEAQGRARMVGLLVAFVGTMELLLLAGDLLTLLMAWELVGVLSWGLIAHHWRGDAPAQATHAFLATRVGDLGLFLAAGATFAATGTFDLAALADAGGSLLAVVAAGVLLAAMAKSAQAPFSPWLFSAMAGPTPASALLHSATMVAAGAYLVARLQPVLDGVSWFGPVTIGVGLATALSGGLVAAVQPEAKRLLAASTSAHYGLMFVAVGAGYPAVAIAHLVAHGLFKALLFISAGVAIDASGTTELAGMRLGRRLPLIAGLTALGTLALAAVPPLGGAWTKEEIVAAGAHAAPWVGLLVVAAGALSAFYAARFQLLAYGRGPEALDHPSTARLAGLRNAVAALAVLAGAGVLLGLVWTPWGEERVLRVTAATLPPSAAWEIPASLIALAVSIYTAVLLDRNHRLAVPSATAGWARVARWFGLASVARFAVVDPTLALARALARVDDHVVDAGVRGVAAGGAGLSRLLAVGDDRVVDAGVRGAARLGVWSAAVLDRVGELSFDGVVEGIARVTGAAGRDGRRLQTGQTHHYYAGIAVGLVVLVLVTVAWR